MYDQEQTAKVNKMPEGQGKRDVRRPRYDYIPIEFDDELASIFEEGRRPRLGMPDGYGDSWMLGGDDFLLDCLNHAHWHMKKFMNGDRSENHLSKVAWNCLVVRYHMIRREKDNALAQTDARVPTHSRGLSKL